MRRIYLDNCCYNRLFDEKTQQRVQEESNAIKEILLSDNRIIIGSHILKFEISNINDIGKRLSIVSLYNQAVTETVKIDDNVVENAKKLVKNTSIHEMDALHLSCAIFGNADIFLTVDDKLIRACSKLNLNIKVINPVNLGEWFYGEHRC